MTAEPLGLQVFSLQSLVFYSVVMRKHFQPTEDCGELHITSASNVDLLGTQILGLAHSRPVLTETWDWKLEMHAETALCEYLVHIQE